MAKAVWCGCYRRASAFIGGCFILGAIVVAPMGAHAQGYPARPIRLIVPSSAGGGTDTTTRLVAAKLGEHLNQRVVVDNRPGAASIVGSEVVAKLHEGVVHALKDPETRKRFVASGAEPVGNTPEEFAARIRADIEKWGKVVRAAGIKPE